MLTVIDPFDYDVFRPHMARMLDRQLQRSTVSENIKLPLSISLSNQIANNLISLYTHFTGITRSPCQY